MTQKPFEKILKAVGTALADLREKKGYAQLKEFAADHGLAEVHYWRIEHGKTNMTLKSLAKILVIHDIALDHFFCQAMNPKTNPPTNFIHKK